MTAQINLRKLTGIQVNGKKVVTNVSKAGEEILLKEGINALKNNEKIVFAGQDYKGTFTASGPKSNDAISGKLELYLERPENHFTIKDVKINVHATNGKHTFTGTGKDGGATIDLVFYNKGVGLNPGHVADDKLTITEKDSGWFTTGLTLNGITPEKDSSLKFGEWNDFDLSNQSYVDISFA